MPKTFEYKDAKELVNFYKELLKNLKTSEKIKQNCLAQLKTQSDFIQSVGFFNNLVKKDIVGAAKENINISSADFDSFLLKVYRFVESSRYNDVCNSLYQSFGPLVEKNVSSLSVGKNPLFWMFSSKNKKSDAEEAYEKLLNMKNDSFVLSAADVLNKIADLDKIDVSYAKKEILNNKREFKDDIQTYGSTIFTDNGPVLFFKTLFDKYEKALNNFKILKETINKEVDEITNATKTLLANELVRSLREIPVEELARDKSGIKTKYLKDAGYDSIADVYGASLMQVASIYGISQDKAYTIKNKCNEYAKKLNREMKIKLSLDDKSKHATKVVETIYFYLIETEFNKKIENLNSEYGNKFKKSLESLKSVGNGVKWFLLSDSEKYDIKSDYEVVWNILSSQYIPLSNEIFEKIKVAKDSSNVSENAWDDFASNSIKYYNVIEEVCPGILGNDDSIYGLPQELARQIQEECFFPDGLLCTLRKYQEWGVKYILHQEKVLLGDEMGLGKTIQAIATMVSLKNTGATHFMVVCPASIVTNWVREIVKHSRLRAIKIHGRNKKSAFDEWLKVGGVAVTNYESTNSINFDEDFNFDLLIVDEAHYIKNESSQRSVNTKNIATHANRLLFMTGTALENNVDEMITLIDILRPSIASSIKSYAFMSSAPQFREKISPVYYRRKREDVLTELPDKTESKEWCNLNPEEERIYEEAVLNQKFFDARRVSWNIDDLNKSCKAIRLKEIVEEAEAEGRKVLVFSFFLDTLAKIHEFLEGRCLNPINGSINVNRRQEIIDEFEQAPAGKVLLAQINTGGVGLNIQAASVVVICEPQFKPSIENQAISRAYRMGQTRKVLVYRLLCEDTIEERMIQTLEKKQEIFDTFADKSVAAQQSLEIDEKTFGNIIQEEIERINKKRGIPSEASLSD